MDDIYPRYTRIDIGLLENDLETILKEKINENGHFTISDLINLGATGLSVIDDPNNIGWKSLEWVRIVDDPRNLYIKTILLPSPSYIVRKEPEQPNQLNNLKEYILNYFDNYIELDLFFIEVKKEFINKGGIS